MKEIKKILFLEAAAREGRPEFRELRRELEDEGLLSFDSIVTTAGRQVLALFRDELRKVIAPLETYREVVLEDGRREDARLAVASYLFHKRRSPQHEAMLESIVLALYWDEFIGAVLRRPTYLAGNELEARVRELVRAGRWTRLGRNPREAARQCELLVNPAHNEKGLLVIK